MVANRDRVWKATLEKATDRKVTTKEIEETLGEDAPSHRCIHETLNSMVDLGVLTASGGAGSSPREYQLSTSFRGTMHDATLVEFPFQQLRDSFDATDRGELYSILFSNLDGVSGDAWMKFQGKLLSGEGTVKDHDGNIVHIEDGF